MFLKRFPYRKFFITSVVLITILCYLSLHIPPHAFWPAAFFSFGIPFVVSLNFLLLTIALIQKRLTAFIWFLLFILGAPSLLRTFRFHRSHNTNTSVQVLSFNVKLFRKSFVYDQFSSELINWVTADTSSIKCIQEYSTNANWANLDVTKKMEDLGYQGYTFIASMTDGQHNPGMAIFTKHKIIGKGLVWQDTKTLNAAIFADLEIKGKLLRVYNVHLSSMSLKARPNGWGEEVAYILDRLKTGSIKRSNQADQLLAHINSSPYPVIVCGDFNETPYSYVYSSFRKKLNNAFEKKGCGFGFTLNQKPYYIRIDNQFYSPEIKAQKFHVDRSMRISDHFPIYGFYTLPE